MKEPITRRRFLTLGQALVVVILLGSALAARAQLVADGATNTINGTSTNLGATNLIVGTNGTNTRLTITGGGTVANSNGHIGFFAGADSNQVIVIGTNSAWNNSAFLFVGDSGSFNTLLIADGGTVSAVGGVTVGNFSTSTNNRVTVDGGTLRVTNAGGTAALDIRRGTNVLNAGRVEADQLLLTNAQGTFEFNGGTLVTRGATISNGQNFVVGANPGFTSATWDVRSNTAPTTVANDLIVGSSVANALSFSGANQYVAVTNFSAIAPTNEVTVEFWAFANVNAEQSAFMLEPDDFTNRFNAHISFIDGRTHWDFGNVSNATARIAVTNPPGTISNWIHYALVASQSSNHMRIYRNGILATNRPGMIPFLRRTNELRIGGSTGYFLRGRIDEFRVWNAAISQSQIQSNLSRVLSGTESNLVLYYRFDSTNGTVATNSASATGPAYDGTLVNGPAWIPSGAFQAMASSTDQASLLITNGGTLVVGGSSLIGNTASASNNFALVAGPGSTWSNSGGLYAGASGSFNSLFISNGGRVASGFGAIGNATGANSNQVIVTGTNSVWASSNNLDVGASGAGNTLLITNGGRVTNNLGTIGVNAGAINNQVIVTDPNSRWSGSNLTVGLSGASNRLSIANGGQVAGGFGYVGYAAGGSNNQVIVGGLDSLWTNSSDLFVGLNGSGNTVFITNGGQAVNQSGYVGYGLVAKNNQVVVTGTNSAWINSDQIQVGNAGPGNSLLIVSGGRVAGGLGFIGNAAVASNNQVTVTGANSVWTNSDSLRVGNFGSFNSLLINSGGVVANDHGYIGHDSDAANNQVVVSGTNSMWTNKNTLSVGFQGSGNTLLITNGAQVANSAGFIGFNASSGSNQVIVTGTNSAWRNGADLHVGNFGSASSLLVTNHAAVQAANVYVGGEGGSAGNLISVGNGTLTVTNVGGTAALDVRRGSVLFNGGTITADRLLLTNAAGNFNFNSGTLVTLGATINNGQPFVVGANAGPGPATWDARGNTSLTTVDNGVVIGSDAANSKLLITNGGTLAVAGSSTVGQSGTASNNLAVVSGPGSFWTNSGVLYVGFDGPDNTLLITNGGRVQSDFGIIGYSPLGGGNNNQVIVTGTNSMWVNTSGLLIGNFGSANALHIISGGAVVAANAYVGAEAPASGNLLAVGNGTLTVTNNSGTAELDVRAGSGVFKNGGTITTDRFLLTNAGGSFAFGAGTLNARSASVANGTAFTVGDGVSAATYRLSGAATNHHAFADGLVISSNATLTGNGTISGLVTNLGIIATGNSAGGLRIDGSLSLAASAGISLEIGGLIATNQYDRITVTNFVQFAGTLSLALINGFTPGPGDSFLLMNFSSHTGTFANATNGAVVLTADHQRQFTVTYTPTNLVAGNFQLSPETLILTSITPAPGQVTVQFKSVSGNTYEIQFASTLTNWTPVVGATFTAPEPGVTQWIDDGTLTGGLSAARFYRVRLVP